MARGGGSGLDVSGLIVPEDIHTAPTPGVSVRTSPDTFGAQIGRAQESLGNAIAGAGKEIGNVFLSIAKEQSAAENDQALTGLQDNLQQKFQDWSQNNQGFNAINSLPAFKESIDSAIGEHGQGLGGLFGFGDHAYERQAAKWRTHYLQSATAYAAKQQEHAADASYTSYLTKTAEASVLNRTNDAAVEDNLNAISSRATQYWSDKGLDKDTVAEQAKAARGNAVTSLYNAYLSDYQYDKALNLYEANKDKVDGGSLDKMTHALTGVQDNAIAAQALNAYGPQGEHATNYNGPKPQGYTSGMIDVEGKQYSYGSGGAGPDHPHIPYGDYPITPGTVGAWGKEHGAIGLNNNRIWDASLGRAREGIEIHAGASDAAITQGCIAIAGKDWPEFKQRVMDMRDKYGTVYLHVDEHGASVTHDLKNLKSAPPTMTFNRPSAAYAMGHEGGNPEGLIRHFEGFRQNAYWDSNHWRVGYGSDTITHADGRIEPVTAFTKVTQEDAERDLTRRVAASQAVIQKQIGAEAWQRLNPNARSALTSVAYNYGTLPQNVAQAAISGGNIPQAIADLRGHNGGINANRRMQEASIAGGGTFSGGGGNSVPQARYAYDTQGAIRSVMMNDNIPLDRRIAIAQKIHSFGSLMKEKDDEAATAIWPKVFKNEVTIDQVYGLPLQPETKKQMGEYIASHAQNAEKEERTYGNGYNDILQRMDKPESEGGITSVQQLFAAKNNGQLTTAGLDKSISYYNQLHKGEGAENRDDWQLFAQEMNRLKQDIVHEKDIPGLPHQRDPMGEKLYNQIYRNIHDQFENTLKSKDNSREASRKFLDDLDSTVMGMYRKMRNPAQELALKLAQNRGMAEAVEGEQKQITAPPLGVDKDKWGDLMRAPPMNPKDSKPFPQDRWAQGVKALLANKDVPAAYRAWDAGPFGHEYKADDLIKMLISEQEAAK